MPRLLASEHDELQRCWAELLDDPDHTMIGERGPEVGARLTLSELGRVGKPQAERSAPQPHFG
jgi:hypothetical protein